MHCTLKYTLTCKRTNTHIHRGSEQGGGGEWKTDRQKAREIDDYIQMNTENWQEPNGAKHWHRESLMWASPAQAHSHLQQHTVAHTHNTVTNAHFNTTRVVCAPIPKTKHNHKQPKMLLGSINAITELPLTLLHLFKRAQNRKSHRTGRQYRWNIEKSPGFPWEEHLLPVQKHHWSQTFHRRLT